MRYFDERSPVIGIAGVIHYIHIFGDMSYQSHCKSHMFVKEWPISILLKG